jgi:hypothetical protein
MIKTICSALCALAIVCASSGPLLAETGTPAVHPKTSGNFSPVIRLAAQCKQDGKPCKKNDQCCSGNCQKGTDMPKGTCLHGD